MQTLPPRASERPSAPPARGDLAGLRRHWRADLLSGFLVFLIALPLCLGISMASGYPPIAGIFTAIVGGIVGAFLSNAELAIKGPAAGLIVIAVGAVQELGQGDDLRGYQLALGVGVAAGVVQIAFGLLRTGILGEFFPLAAVHGMLAAIGIIIASKQLHTVLGVVPAGKDPFSLLAELPRSVMHLDPEIALIGSVSLLLLFGLPRLRWRMAKLIPAPMVVLVIAVGLGILFDLSHEHTYSLFGHEYHLGPQFLVRVPQDLLQAITFPDFSAVFTQTGFKYIVMFALVGTLESHLSVKAIDLLDPERRRTDLDRDAIALGVGNILASAIGGLPMISEIVRSSANLNNGARTRFANLFHGLFLLACVMLVPGLIGRVPYAALAAMLVYTGYRLASPHEFVSTYRVGRAQFAIFAATLLATLATDLLVGIATGVLVKLLLHVSSGVPLRALFRSRVTVVEDADRVRVCVNDAAIFSNWIGLKRRLGELGFERDVELDLSRTRLVDHTVMTKLEELANDFAAEGKELRISGLDSHRSVSTHPRAARRRALA